MYVKNKRFNWIDKEKEREREREREGERERERDVYTSYSVSSRMKLFSINKQNS